MLANTIYWVYCYNSSCNLLFIEWAFIKGAESNRIGMRCTYDLTESSHDILAKTKKIPDGYPGFFNYVHIHFVNK
jgi:hypothetical protein